MRDRFPFRTINCRYSEISTELTLENAEMQSQLAKLRSKIQMAGLRRAFLQVLLALASIVWVSSAFPCWGQTITGSIVGTVADSTGAIVPQVAVTATNASTGVISRTIADSSGHDGFLSLPAELIPFQRGKPALALQTLQAFPLGSISSLRRILC
jgi:hypothetical protein